MKKYYILITTIGILFASSNKVFPQNLSSRSSKYYLNNNINVNPGEKVQIDSTNDFPLEVGDKWIYFVQDSINNISDTVTVKINKVYYLPNGTIRYLWLYQFTNRLDTLYVELTSDTLRFVPVSQDDFYNGISKLVLPLKIGNMWGGIGDEEGKVESIDTVIVPGGTFSDAYQILQYGTCCNDYNHIQFWIQPGIGIVKEVNSILITVEPNSRRLEYWELLSYSLKTITGVKSSNNIPQGFLLMQNYPNPFNPTTRIKYSIPNFTSTSSLLKGSNEDGFVSLKVYDILGREVATLVNERQKPGEYVVEFSAKGGSAYGGNAKDLTSGVYFYQLKFGEFIQTKKMILLQ